MYFVLFSEMYERIAYLTQAVMEKAGEPVSNDMSD